MKITKEEFSAYEKVRESGKTNMFNLSMVEMLSGLSREKLLYIMENYEALMTKLVKKEKKEEE